MKKNKLAKILGVVLTVTLLVSLFGAALPVTGSPADNAWEEFKVPSSTGDVLAPTAAYVSGPIAQGIDGTLWAYNNHSSSGVFFKSTDGGHTWSKKTSHTAADGAIVDIGTSPSDASIIYIATATTVRASIDGGATFVTKVALVGETITSIDVGELGGNHMVLIGTSTGSFTGKVYLFNEGAYPASLTDMAVGGLDALDVALSPNFGNDQGLFVVGLKTAIALNIMNKIGAAAWGSNLANATAVANSTTMASIAFPDDFDAAVSGMANWYVGYNGAGTAEGVYLVQGFTGTTPIVRLTAQVDVASLAVSGSTGSTTNMLVGLANATIIFSNNGGATWMSNLATGIKKQPTGTANAIVVMDNDFDANGTAWAATSGLNGAVSRTLNGTIAWNQVGLINATVTRINDVSVIDGVVFIATDNGSANSVDSIWRNASSWERVFHSSLAGDGLDLVEATSSYTTDSAVFVGEIGDDHIWQSTDGGEIWTVQRTAVSANITAWIVVSPTELIVGAVNNYTYRTTNNGLTWIKSGTGLYGDPYSISRKSGSYYIMGTANGYPYYSTNSGDTWTILSAALGSTNLSVYWGDKMWAASSGGGVWRRDTSFGRIDNIDTNSDTVASATGLVFGSDGTVYATDSSAAGEGIGRSLSGTTNGGNLGSLLSATTYPFFEKVNGTATGILTKPITGLWIDGDKLWTVYNDTTNDELWTYVDGLSGQITGVAATFTETTATLEWTALAGATMYTVQVNTREDFLGVNLGGTPTTTQLSTIPVTDLTSGTAYYIRVRGTSPIRTLYSDVTSFTTTLGQPTSSSDFTAPAPAAQDVSINPLFQWGMITGATGYEFQLTDDPGFFATPSLLMDHATPAVNYYAPPQGLAYATTYYWRVRATGTGTDSAWTNGVFTTEVKPVEDDQIIITEPGETIIEIVEVPIQTIIEQPIPSYLLVTVIIIGAVLIVALIILIVRTRRVA